MNDHWRSSPWTVKLDLARAVASSAGQTRELLPARILEAFLADDLSRFNSSLATVVPDNFNRTLTQADFEPSSEGSSSGPLGSQSSMGRLDRALAAGDEGLMHLLEGPGDGEFERLVSLAMPCCSVLCPKHEAKAGELSSSLQIHEIESLPPDSQPLASQSSLIFELPTFMTDISSSSDDLAPYPQTASPLDLNMGIPTVSPNMLQHHQADRSADASSSSYSAHGTEFRPQSAQSYHSHRSHRSHATSISGSEYSFSSTDVSEDYDMEGRGSTAADGVRQLNMAGMRLGESAQRAYPGGNSPITPGPSTGIGPIRGMSEEEEKRQAKLERGSCRGLPPPSTLLTRQTVDRSTASRLRNTANAAEKNPRRSRAQSPSATSGSLSLRKTSQLSEHGYNSSCRSFEPPRADSQLRKT